MLWIRRNLLLTLSIAGALALLGLAVAYLISGISAESANETKLQENGTELKRLIEQSPSPNAENVKIVRTDAGRLDSYISQTTNLFKAVTAPAKLDMLEFKSTMENSVADLKRDASIAGVQLPGAKYFFTFETHRTVVNYGPGSLEPLFIQLQDLKSLCAILFQSKVHSLESLKRCNVCKEDGTGAADFLSRAPLTNEFGIVTFYDVTVRCFSTELGNLLENFSRSPEFFVVKTVTTQPAEAGGGGEGPGGGVGGESVPKMTPTPTAVPTSGAPTPAAKGGKAAVAPPQQKTLLDERPLRVTLQIELFKPRKAGK